jgi:hypothetical protein
MQLLNCNNKNIIGMRSCTHIMVTNNCTAWCVFYFFYGPEDDARCVNM